MINARKEGHGSIEVADPDLGCAGVEIERPFFVHLALGVRRGNHFDTDFGCAREDKGSLPEFGSIPGEPSQVNGLDAISSREWTLCQSAAVRKKIFEQVCNVPLPVRVRKTWRRSHEEMSVPIGLDAVRELRQAWISRDFRPTIQVEPSLRLEIQELDRDRHTGKIRQKWKNR
jgi:hypothetical protein